MSRAKKSVGPVKVQTSKRIKMETFRIFIVAVGVLALAFWNWEFVWAAISSNIYLNGTIISVFVFGFFLAIMNIWRLRNEEVALLALREAFEDVRVHPSRSRRDPYWRHYRCLEPGYVFRKPRIFGHVFELTFDKIMRAKHLRISVGTMQSLVREVEMRFMSERSLLQYVTGILVFLGLIGTFIGLMDVVGSVGNILGSIAASTGEAGSSAVVLESLMRDLQAPLTGMATGFSSSLFGLFGSLILGLVTQFLQRATSVLKGQFESWLANIAEIEGEETPVAEMQVAGATEGGLTGQNLDRLIETLEQNVDRPVFEADLFEKLIESHAIQNARLEEMSLHMDKLAKGYEDMRESYTRQASLAAAGTQAQREAAETARQTNRSIVEGLSGVERVLESLNRAQTEQMSGLRSVMERQAHQGRVEPQEGVPPSDQAMAGFAARIDQSLSSAIANLGADLSKAMAVAQSAATQSGNGGEAKRKANEDLWAIDWTDDVEPPAQDTIKDYTNKG